MTKAITVQLHMYRSCPQDPGYFKLFKGLLLVGKKSRIFETNHKLERNQTYMPYSIKCEIIKDSIRN